jgi:hypothetical protein
MLLDLVMLLPSIPLPETANPIVMLRHVVTLLRSVHRKLPTPNPKPPSNLPGAR